MSRYSQLLRRDGVAAGLYPGPVFLFLLFCGLLLSSGTGSAATLTGRFDYGPYGVTVNLSEEGTLDWGHWGFWNEWTYNHKYGVARQITYSFITVEDYAGWPGPYVIPYSERWHAGITPFSWTDGTPVPVVGAAYDGVSMYGDKAYLGTAPGFHLECPADTSPKTLRVYVGNSWGPATFTATLNGLTYQDDTLDGRDGGEGATVSGVYTLDFQADSPGQTLIVEFTCTDSWWFNTLQAATLSGPNAPPTVAITAPTDGTNFSSPATFSVIASAADSDGTVTNLTLLSGTAPVATSASGALSVTLSNQPPGAYDLRAVATDNGGLSITSFPVRVYVIAGGGTLTGSVGLAPYNLDLTAEGTTDWAHWGLNFPTSFDHKSGAAQLIPDLVLLNASATDLRNYNDGWFTAYTWSDGTPTAEAYGSPTGVLLSVTNNPLTGFQLTVPATSQLRCLKVYVGLIFAQGRFDARLSDFSALPYSDDSIFQPDDFGDAAYTLTFASPNPGANLIVTWTPAIVLNPFYADFRWQAATLSEQQWVPILHLTCPPSAPGEFALSFYAQTGATYTVLFLDQLGSTNWQTLTNFIGTGAETLVIDHDVGAASPASRPISPSLHHSITPPAVLAVRPGPVDPRPL